MSRIKANPNALKASLTRFREGLAFKALMRARAAVLAGGAVEERDREFVAMKLELAAADELARVKAMTPSVFKAYAADYINRDLGTPVKQAMEFLTDDSATLSAIAQQLKKIRSESAWRQQEKLAKRAKRSKKGRA